MKLNKLGKILTIIFVSMSLLVIFLGCSLIYKINRYNRNIVTTKILSSEIVEDNWYIKDETTQYKIYGVLQSKNKEDNFITFEEFEAFYTIGEDITIEYVKTNKNGKNNVVLGLLYDENELLNSELSRKIIIRKCYLPVVWVAPLIIMIAYIFILFSLHGVNINYKVNKLRLADEKDLINNGVLKMVIGPDYKKRMTKVFNCKESLIYAYYDKSNLLVYSLDKKYAEEQVIEEVWRDYLIKEDTSLLFIENDIQFETILKDINIVKNDLAQIEENTEGKIFFLANSIIPVLDAFTKEENITIENYDELIDNYNNFANEYKKIVDEKMQENKDNLEYSEDDALRKIDIYLLNSLYRLTLDLNSYLKERN